jgi:hypothetical protein
VEAPRLPATPRAGAGAGFPIAVRGDEGDPERAGTLPAVGIREFETRLERLVEGTFSKAFRSGLQPVELGRRITRTLDSGRTLGVRGTVAPNAVTVTLSPGDAERFAGFGEALERELAEAARQHARSEHYHFLGPITVEFVTDPDRKLGQFAISARIVEGPGGRVGSLVFADGGRLELGPETVTMGRLAECAIPLADPQASREHCTIRPAPDGFVLTDLGSTNGTYVNDVRVTDHDLRDGDVIRIGVTTMRFEAS